MGEGAIPNGTLPALCTECLKPQIAILCPLSLRCGACTEFVEIESPQTK